MKKDIMALLSVSLVAMNVPSTSPFIVDKDLSLDARKDSDDSHSTHFDDSIPTMNGIPANAFSWHGETSWRFVFLFPHVGLIP